MTVYESDDHNTIIEFDKKSISNRFLFNNFDISKICIITIKSKLGYIIKSIYMSDIDIMNLLDNIYAFLQYSNDILYSVNDIYTNGSIIFKFSVLQIKDNINDSIESINLYSQILSVLSYIDDQLIIICTININNIEDLTNCIIEEFVNNT